MKIFQILIQTLLALTLLSACSDKDKDSNYKINSETFNQLTVQEQVRYAPTDLFRAVYTNDSALFDEQLKTSFIDFRKKNEDGDTALAVAIKLRRANFVNPLLKKATFEDLKEHNQGNRSFLSLLAEYNYEEGLDEVRDTYIGQVGPLQVAWTNFVELDFADDKNMRAAHYAQTGSFIDKLERLWFWGIADFRHPWDGFYNHRDEHGDTFLHVAAEYDKSEILAWYIQRNCGQGPLENENNWPIFRGIGWTLRKVSEYWQDVELPIFLKKQINVQNDVGNTPLHLAAKNGNARSIEILLQCSQIDPSMKNWDWQHPVTLLLKNLDQQIPVVQDNYKRSFNMLIDLTDPLWSFLPTMTFKNIANDTDVNGLSAIHYAGRLSDRYFYGVLKRYESSNPDDNGIVPQDRHRGDDPK